MVQKGGFYIIKDKIMPEILKKTVKAKELLKSGKAKTVNEATEFVGMSRSAFYKYRDYIFPFLAPATRNDMSSNKDVESGEDLVWQQTAR